MVSYFLKFPPPPCTELLIGYFGDILEFPVADRIGMAVLRLLGRAAACVILLFFAIEDCKLYWSGCI